MSNNFPPTVAGVEDALVDIGRRLDMVEVERCVALSRIAQATYMSRAPMPPPPPSVDHSAHISYIRHQGAYACGLNAAAACWDILLTKYCWPHFHPNVSVNRMVWAWARTLRCYPEGKPCGQRSPGKVPGLWGLEYETLDDYLHNFGCPTEGTELSNSDAIQWPTDEGNYECSNYRLDKHPLATQYVFDPKLDLNKTKYWQGGGQVPVGIGGNYVFDAKVDLNELKYWLNGGPVRVTIWGNHFVTLVGYDDNKARFKFINSWGDRWHDAGAEDGFGFVDYANLHKEISSAQVYQYRAARPIPCAKIRFKSQYRQDVHLWLGLEGKTAVKRVWPTGQRQDNSWNLSLIVALPRGSSWPPSAQNHVFLDVYDTGAHSNAGGTIEEFTVGFCGQYHYCGDIVHGVANNIGVGGQPPSGSQGMTPKSFKPGEMVRLTVP